MVRTSLSFSCLTTSVTQPSPKLSQASTSTRARAEQRPQRHFDGAGVGGRHDADAVVGGNLQHFARQVDRPCSLALPIGARCERPSGASARKRPASSPDAWRKGPEEKFGLAVRTVGLSIVAISLVLSKLAPCLCATHCEVKRADYSAASVSGARRSASQTISTAASTLAAVLALAHDADHRLGAGRADDQPAACAEPRVGRRRSPCHAACRRAACRP